MLKSKIILILNILIADSQSEDLLLRKLVRLITALSKLHCLGIYHFIFKFGVLIGSNRAHRAHLSHGTHLLLLMLLLQKNFLPSFVFRSSMLIKITEYRHIDALVFLQDWWQQGVERPIRCALRDSAFIVSEAWLHDFSTAARDALFVAQRLDDFDSLWARFYELVLAYATDLGELSETLRLPAGEHILLGFLSECVLIWLVLLDFWTLTVRIVCLRTSVFW